MKLTSTINKILNIKPLKTFDNLLKKNIDAILQTKSWLYESKKIIPKKALNISHISLKNELNQEEIKKLNFEMDFPIKAERRHKNLYVHLKQELEKTYKNEENNLHKCVIGWHTHQNSSLKCFSMYNYYPTNCHLQISSKEWDIRNLVWDFKASPNKNKDESTIVSLHKIAAQKVTDKMSICLRHFFGDSISKMTLVCIPSSHKETTKKRYEDFSNMICENLGMINAYKYIQVTKDGEATHLGGKTPPKLSIDPTFFINKNVLLFDDVITTGNSMEKFRIRLTKAGANVIAGFSIARTTHQRKTYNPIDTLIKGLHN